MKIADAAIPGIKKTPDPKMLSDAMLTVIGRVEAFGEKNGIDFPVEVVFHGGKEILLYIAEQSGVQLDDKMIQQVVGTVVGQYLDSKIKTGKMTEQQVANLARPVEQPNG